MTTPEANLAPDKARYWLHSKLFILALIVRLLGVSLAIRVASRFLVAADTVGAYYPIARSLVSGGGYAIRGDHAGATSIPPLYPCFLALLLACYSGDQAPLWLTGALNAVFRALACVFVYLLTRSRFSDRAAFGAVLLYLLDPWETLWVGYVLKDSLAVAAFLGAVWLIARLEDEPAPRTAAISGVAIGIATLARFASLGLALVAIARIFTEARGPSERVPLRQKTLQLACLFIGLAATLSPWLVRNWLVTGEPTLSNHFAGRYVYTTNAMDVASETAGYARVPYQDPVLHDAPGEERSPTRKELRLLGLGLSHMASNPVEVLGRVAGKLVNMWRPTFASPSSTNVLVLALPYLMLMGVSLLGVFLAVRDRRPSSPIILVLVMFVLLHLVFWAEIRNRQYLMPLLYCFGGYTVSRALEHWGRAR